MISKRTHFIQMDDTLRLVFAFYSCISHNPNWIIESDHAKHNREIAKKFLYMENDADYYFMVDNRFYSFSVERIDEDVIHCMIEEYDTFYDLSNKRLSLEFSYHIPTNSLIELEEIKEIKVENILQKKKIA